MFCGIFSRFLSEKEEICSRQFCVCGGGDIYKAEGKKKNDEALCVVCDGFAPKNVIRTTVSCRGKY